MNLNRILDKILSLVQHFILNAILSFMSLCMFSCLSIGWSFTCPGHYVDCIPFGWETLSYSIISSNTQFTVTCWTVISSFDNHASVQRAWFATLNSLRKLQSTLLKSLKQLTDKSIQTNKKKKICIFIMISIIKIFYFVFLVQCLFMLKVSR